MQTVVIACEVCGCKESHGHVDPLAVDESFKLERSRADLRARNTTQHIRNRALVTGNGEVSLALAMSSYENFLKGLKGE